MQTRVKKRKQGGVQVFSASPIISPFGESDWPYRRVDNRLYRLTDGTLRTVIRLQEFLESLARIATANRRVQGGSTYFSVASMPRQEAL